MKSVSTKPGFRLSSGTWPKRFMSMLAILAILLMASACSQTETTKNTPQSSGSTSKATTTTRSTAKKVTNPQIDDTVYFGHYYTARGIEPIAWKIIDLEKERAMIISEQVIDTKPFNNDREFVDWVTCSLRRWLNNEFLNSAFTSSEQKEIYIEEYDYQLKDPVLILSLEQIDYLEVSQDTLQAAASELAVAKDVAVINNLGLWWLRDLDGQKNRTYSARFYQEKARSGTYTVNNVGVRPVLWVNISALSAEPAAKPTPAKATPKVTGKPVAPNTTAADYDYAVSPGGYTITHYKGSQTDVIIPSQIEGRPVTRIGRQSFVQNAKITSVTIPDTVQVIENAAFYGCTSLKSVKIGAGVTTIRITAFKNCTALTELTLGNNIQVISLQAFRGCPLASQLTLPASVAIVGPGAFNDCANLRSVNVPNQEAYIDPGAFDQKQVTINRR